MDIVAIVAVLLIAAAGSILLFWFSRLHQAGWQVDLRPIRGFEKLKEQSDRAAESGLGVHLSLGQADLGGRGGPTSVAALEALDFVNKDGAWSGVGPKVTTGDGTLLLAAQDSQRGAQIEAGRTREAGGPNAQFLAGQGYPMSYAAGVTFIVNDGGIGSNLLLGRFGSEIAIMAESGERQQLEQVIGSDDPVATAIGAAATENLLIGEELFAAGAYLHDKAAFLASLQLQDVMRVAAIVIVLVVALLNFIL